MTIYRSNPFVYPSDKWIFINYDIYDSSIQSPGLLSFLLPLQLRRCCIGSKVISDHHPILSIWDPFTLQSMVLADMQQFPLYPMTDAVDKNLASHFVILSVESMYMVSFSDLICIYLSGSHLDVNQIVLFR